jgi:hypothetical protein
MGPRPGRLLRSTSAFEVEGSETATFAPVVDGNRGASETTDVRYTALRILAPWLELTDHRVHDF